VVLFAGHETRDEILKQISSSEPALDNLLAAANVGMAFMLISIFESQLVNLIDVSATKLKNNHASGEYFDAEVTLERRKELNSATMGRLVVLLEASGVDGIASRYLKALVDIRNEFIHHFGKVVPFPGDWERYGYTLEQFSAYTRFVTRRFHFASNYLPRILSRAGLIALDGSKDFGYLAWHPEFPGI
jgi:hypothetical protein